MLHNAEWDLNVGFCEKQDQEKVSFLKCFSFIPEKFKAGLGMKIIFLIDCRYRHYVTYLDHEGNSSNSHCIRRVL